MNLVGRIGRAFLVCLIVFSSAKIIASAIPSHLVNHSLAESLEILENEGGGSDYCFLVGTDYATRLDNYTTAIMLKVCGSNYVCGLEAAFGDYNLSDPSLKQGRQTGSLREQLSEQGMSGSAVWVPYARYWHGYVVILKPLLIFLNLNEIRMLTILAAMSLLIANVSILAKRFGIASGLAFGLPFFAVNLLVALLSLSLSFTFLISLAAALYILERDSGGCAEPRDWAIPFFIFGALTAFFDFLCTPLITLGIPLSVLFFNSQKGKPRIKDIAAVFMITTFFWALGYGLLWLSKWVISSFILGQDIIGNALNQFTHRIGDATSDAVDAAEMKSILSAPERNFQLLFPKWALKTLFICTAGFAAFLIVTQRKPNVANGILVISLLIVAILPLLWYLFASNHSYVHYWFTYRTQVISLVSICFALCLLFSRNVVSCDNATDFN